MKHGQANIRKLNACPNIEDARRLKVKVVFLPFPVLAFGNAGPDCDPDGSPLSGLTFWFIDVSVDGKLERFIVYHSYLLSIKQLVKKIIYLISKII